MHQFGLQNRKLEIPVRNHGRQHVHYVSVLSNQLVNHRINISIPFQRLHPDKLWAGRYASSRIGEKPLVFNRQDPNK